MDRYDIAIIGTGPAGISAAITARVRNKNIILINRPEIPQKETDKNLFWYVTQNGKLCKCFQAYSKTWTNFLTFADKGDYTVTLVIDYDDATGEYTPISNTIEYTVE